MEQQTSAVRETPRKQRKRKAGPRERVRLAAMRARAEHFAKLADAGLTQAEIAATCVPPISQTAVHMALVRYGFIPKLRRRKPGTPPRRGTYKARQVITPEMVGAMRAARADGATIGEVAQRFDLARSTVWVKTTGYVRPNEQASGDDLNLRVERPIKRPSNHDRVA